MNEKDFELLESYLDDELTSVQVDDLRGRLSQEPALATLLNELRIERDARSEIFSSFEPSDHSVDLLMRNIHREVNRNLLMERFTRGVRVFGAVAACVAMGFVGGYLVRGNSVAPTTITPEKTALVSSDIPSGADGQIVWNTNQTPTTTRDPNGYLVSFSDDQGNLIGSQRFKTLNEAREFMRDFQLRQQQHKQLQNNGVKMVADEF